MDTGTIIHGTLRREDLIPEFCSEIRARCDDAGTLTLVAQIERDAAPGSGEERYHWYQSEAAGWALEYLFDALDAFAPAGHYFGSHPGDGSDFGYWPVDFLE